MSDQNVTPNPATDDGTPYPLRRSTRLNSVSTPKSISRRRSSAFEDAENTPVRRSLRLNQNKVPTPESTKATRIITRRASANEVQTSKRQQTRVTNDTEGNEKQQISRRCVSESPTGKRRISTSEVEDDSTTTSGILRRSARRNLTHSPSFNKQSLTQKLTSVSEDPSEASETNTVDKTLEKKAAKLVTVQLTSSSKEKGHEKENSDPENVEKQEFSERTENETIEISSPKKRNLTRYKKSVNVVEEKEKDTESHSPKISVKTRINTSAIKTNVDDKVDKESRDTKLDISQNKISEDISQFEDISSPTIDNKKVTRILSESLSSNERFANKTVTSIYIEKVEVRDDSLSDANRKEKLVLVENEPLQPKIPKQKNTQSGSKETSIIENIDSPEKSVEDTNGIKPADIDIKVDEYKTAVNVKEHADNHDVPVKDSPSVRHSLELSKNCDSSNNEFGNDKNKEPLIYECLAVNDFLEDSISSSEISLRIDEDKDITEEKLPSGSSKVDTAVEIAAPKEVHNTNENEDSQAFGPLQTNIVSKLDTEKEAISTGTPGKKFEDLNSEKRINNDMECYVSMNSNKEVSNSSSKISPVKKGNMSLIDVENSATNEEHNMHVNEDSQAFDPLHTNIIRKIDTEKEATSTGTPGKKFEDLNNEKRINNDIECRVSMNSNKEVHSSSPNASSKISPAKNDNSKHSETSKKIETCCPNDSNESIELSISNGRLASGNENIDRNSSAGKEYLEVSKSNENENTGNCVKDLDQLVQDPDRNSTHCRMSQNEYGKNGDKSLDSSAEFPDNQHVEKCTILSNKAPEIVQNGMESNTDSSVEKAEHFESKKISDSEQNDFSTQNSYEDTSEISAQKSTEPLGDKSQMEILEDSENNENISLEISTDENEIKEEDSFVDEINDSYEDISKSAQQCDVSSDSFVEESSDDGANEFERLGSKSQKTLKKLQTDDLDQNDCTEDSRIESNKNSSDCLHQFDKIQNIPAVENSQTLFNIQTFSPDSTKKKENSEQDKVKLFTESSENERATSTKYNFHNILEESSTNTVHVSRTAKENRSSCLSKETINDNVEKENDIGTYNDLVHKNNMQDNELNVIEQKDTTGIFENQTPKESNTDEQFEILKKDNDIPIRGETDSLLENDGNWEKQREKNVSTGRTSTSTSNQNLEENSLEEQLIEEDNCVIAIKDLNTNTECNKSLNMSEETVLTSEYNENEKNSLQTCTIRKENISKRKLSENLISRGDSKDEQFIATDIQKSEDTTDHLEDGAINMSEEIVTISEDNESEKNSPQICTLRKKTISKRKLSEKLTSKGDSKDEQFIATDIKKNEDTNHHVEDGELLINNKEASFSFKNDKNIKNNTLKSPNEKIKASKQKTSIGKAQLEQYSVGDIHKSEDIHEFKENKSPCNIKKSDLISENDKYDSCSTPRSTSKKRNSRHKTSVGLLEDQLPKNNVEQLTEQALDHENIINNDKERDCLGNDGSRKKDKKTKRQRSNGTAQENQILVEMDDVEERDDNKEEKCINEYSKHETLINRESVDTCENDLGKKSCTPKSSGKKENILKQKIEMIGNDGSNKKDKKKKRKRSNGTTQENQILKEMGDVEERDNNKEEKDINEYSKDEILENRESAHTFENDVEKKISTPKSTDKKENILKQKISVSLWTPGKEYLANNAKRRKLTLPKEVEDKISEQITQFLNESKESDSSRAYLETEDETEGFLDDMAEEGEESTPSEDSNEIPVCGESVGYSSEDEYEDDSYEKDSFIDDEEYELLSDGEYNIDSDVDSPGHKKDNKNAQCMSKKKWSRIITIEDSSKEDISEEEIINVDEETDAEHENSEVSSPSRDVSDEEESKIENVGDTSLSSVTATSTIPRCRKSSIIVKENISVEDIKDISLRERINRVVESFCTNNYPKGDLTLNVSLDYSPKTEADSPPKLKSAAGKATVTKRQSSTIKISSREDSFKLLPETQDTITVMPSNLGNKLSNSNDISSKTSSESKQIIDERSKSKRKKKKNKCEIDSFESKIQETEDKKSRTIREINNKSKKEKNKSKIDSYESKILEIEDGKSKTNREIKNKPSVEQTKCINTGKELNVRKSKYDKKKYEPDFKSAEANENHEIKLSREVIKGKQYRSEPPLENLSVPKKIKHKKHDGKLENAKPEVTKEITSNRNIETGREQRVTEQSKNKQKKHNLDKDVCMKVAERKSLLNKLFPTDSEVDSTSERRSVKKRKTRTHSPKQTHSVEIEDPDMPKRKRRKITASLSSANDMWNVESVVIKPSHRSNKAVVSSSSAAFDPKDIRNRVMFDKRRVRRV